MRRKRPRAIFNNQFAQGGTLTQIKAALGKIAFAAPSYYSPPQNYIVPKTTEWSVQLERTLGAHDVLAASYVGNHGYDGALSNAWVNAFLLLGSNGQNAYYGTNFAGLPTSAPDPRFLTVTSIQNQGYSNYDAMTLQLRHSLKYGLQGQINWSWSHALSLGTIYNPNDLHFGYGNSGSDVRHAINTDLIWVDPFHFSNRIEKAILGGWTFGMKMFIYTGTPFSSSDANINAQINSGWRLQRDIPGHLSLTAEELELQRGARIEYAAVLDYRRLRDVRRGLRREYSRADGLRPNGPGRLSRSRLLGYRFAALQEILHQGEIRHRVRSAGVQYPEPSQLLFPNRFDYIGFTGHQFEPRSRPAPVRTVPARVRW
ncbi:MAG: hypothetical protein WDO73_33740 [Ignavibacteriota bacterium]